MTGPAAHLDGHADGQHVDHGGHEEMFRQRFWVCLALSVPVLLFSPMLQDWLSFTMPAFPGSAWIGPAFSVFIFFYGGLPFLRMAAVELRNRQPGMMMLISLAISVAFVYSLVALFLPDAGSFFWELVTLIDIMLLGHWIEMRSVRRASGALDELAKLLPDTAERIDASGAIELVPLRELAIGDLVLVRPGAGVPADALVEEGESEVDEAMLTGESNPVTKRAGDTIIGGTVNAGGGSIRARVTATGESMALSGIMRLVKEAQQSKSRTQVLADRAAGWLFYVAIGVALLTLIAWTAAIGFGVETIERVATVLVIACPHALGLAVPLVVAITTSLAASNGILVKDRLALEAAREVDVVVFDKTGTLTKAEHGVVDLVVADGRDEDELLAMAAAIEGDSEHSLARAIRNAARDRALELPDVDRFEAIKGRGVRADVSGHSIHIGGPRLLELLEVSLPEHFSRFAEQAGEKGQTAVYIEEDGVPVAALALADVIRPESGVAVATLRKFPLGGTLKAETLPL